MNVRLGVHRKTGQPVELPIDALARHMHLLGYTGAGKTTTIVTMLVNMLMNPGFQKCVIILDRLGGFSLDLKRWFSSQLLCPPWIRDRVIYVEPAREDRTITLNPLLFNTPGEGYFRTARAAEIILRGFDAQDLGKMPRLMRWLFNSMWAVAQLGLTITTTEHLLFPNSRLHRKLLGCLPESLRHEWNQIIDARNSQAEVQLESTRNRLKPYFDSPVLRAMFASPVNRFDVHRWMREKKVVVVNLAPMGKLPEQSADAIGGLIVNEVFAVARSLPPEQRQETLLILDEFQRFVGPDLEFSLAESRQLKTALVLSHQSMSQLVRGDTDLTSLIFQAQTRLVHRVAAEDARIMSEEFNELTYNPRRILDEVYSRCQRVSGHRLVDIHSQSQTESFAKEWSQSHGEVRGSSRSRSGKYLDRVQDLQASTGQNQSRSSSEGEGEKETRGTSHGVSQSYLPTYEEFSQLASRSYYSYEQLRALWGKRLRHLPPGHGILQIANDPKLYPLIVDRTAPSHLAVDWATVLVEMPSIAAAYDQFVEDNFAKDCFVTPEVAHRESEAQLHRVLTEGIVIHSPREETPPAIADRANVSIDPSVDSPGADTTHGPKKNPFDV